MGSEYLSSTEFQLRIVQPVVTCYTDYAIPVANLDGCTAGKFQKTTNRSNVITTLNLKKKTIKMRKNFLMNTPDIRRKIVFTATKRKKTEGNVKLYVGETDMDTCGRALDTDVESGVGEHTLHLPLLQITYIEDTF